MTDQAGVVEMLYRQHTDDVFRFAMYLAGNRADAEDIAAETFSNALVSTVPIVATTAKGYLLAIARNIFLHGLRTGTRHVPLDSASAWLVDSSDGADVRSERRDELRLASRNLARLSEPDRSALVMRAVNDMTYDEIARVLGISTAAAKVKVHRARLLLAGLQGASNR